MPSLHDFWFLSGDALKDVREGAALSLLGFLLRLSSSPCLPSNWKPIAIALLKNHPKSLSRECRSLTRSTQRILTHKFALTILVHITQ